MAARRRKFRQRMILQYDQCFYCDWPLVDPATLDKRERDREPALATWDHRLPKSRGGVRGDNEVLACYVCNQRKGNRSEVEFRSGDARWLRLRQMDAPAVIRLREEIAKPIVIETPVAIELPVERVLISPTPAPLEISLAAVAPSWTVELPPPPPSLGARIVTLCKNLLRIRSE